MFIFHEKVRLLGWVSEVYAYMRPWVQKKEEIDKEEKKEERGRMGRIKKRRGGEGQIKEGSEMRRGKERRGQGEVMRGEKS